MEERRTMLVTLIIEPDEDLKKKAVKKLLDGIDEDFLAELDAACTNIGAEHDVSVGYEATPVDTSLEAFVLWRHEVDAGHLEGPGSAMDTFALAIGWLCGQGVENDIAVETAELWSNILDDAKCVHCTRQAKGV